MKTIEVGLSNERLITPSGLSIVGEILGNSDIVKNCNKKTDKRSEPQIKTSDILLTYTGLLCQGKTAFDAVREMEEDSEYYKMALGIMTDIPSSEALRQRMDGIGSSLRNEILKSNVTMFQNLGIKPSALPNGYIPVDIDVTPFDNSKTSKEGVSRTIDWRELHVNYVHIRYTYKGFDGYAPMMAYIGTEGYLVNCELREGKQHCQNHTPEFLSETLKLCRKITDAPLLVRLDSGNDAAVNLGILIEYGAWFVIKRNPRNSETKEEWLDDVKSWCKDIRKPRDGKTVYVGSSWKRVTNMNVVHVQSTPINNVAFKDSNGVTKTMGMRIGYEVIERTIDKNGQILLVSDIELNTWWTNLGLPDDDIIELYHAHGESEQYHSEIKTDMDVERLPSGKFDTNELVLELTILAYNILRMIGQESLKSNNSPKTKRPINRRRLRTVINNLILIAGHLTEHARKVILSLGRSNIWRYVFIDILKRFRTASTP